MTAVVCSPDSNLLGCVASSLKSEGFHVWRAEDGDRCVQLCQRHHPELVVLDEAMKDPCAASVMTALRDHADTREVRIVFLDRPDSELG